MAVPPWIALGGTARRYRNAETGAQLSREAYDRAFGSLKKRGAKSFKEAAKRTSPELRAARPSKAASYARKPKSGSKAFSGLKPLAGRRTRSVAIPFHAYWDGEVTRFEDDAEPYRGGYDDAVTRIQNNSRIVSLQVFFSILNSTAGVSRLVPANTAVEPGSAETFDETVADILRVVADSPRVEVIGMEIRVAFKAELLRPAATQGLRTKPKRKR